MSGPLQADRTAPSSETGVRLELKPDMPRTGYVDGAWWPRSRDLRAELPELIAALSSRIGRTVGAIERVGFGRTQWDPIGKQRLLTPTGQVAFDGFQEFTVGVIWVVGRFTDQTPVTLLVVPPETAEADATALLRRASAADNTERSAELLAPRGGTDETARTPATQTAPAAGSADALVRS
jgi:hypothetical protein